MKIVNLKLQNFRNHKHAEIECSPTINLFLGRNGQGKTNILEAIAYLSLGKSFFSVPDGNVVRRGEESFIVHGTFASDEGFNYSVGVRYSDEHKKKEIRINNKDQEKISTLIGKFPVVILYPDQHSITNGGPAERRKFIDIVLSQASPRYFEILTEYRRILKQRNSILNDQRARSGSLIDVLDSWNEPFLEYATEITAFRAACIRDLAEPLRVNYDRIADREEIPGIAYTPSLPVKGEVKKERLLQDARRAFMDTRKEELRYGMTVFGPHRDDLLLTINDLEIRKYASQGQQKSFLVALKISESQYLMDQRREQPIILLDDLFGELDGARASRVLDLTSGTGQTFVTSADERITQNTSLMLNGYAKFLIKNGVVTDG